MGALKSKGEGQEIRPHRYSWLFCISCVPSQGRQAASRISLSGCQVFDQGQPLFKFKNHKPCRVLIPPCWESATDSVVNGVAEIKRTVMVHLRKAWAFLRGIYLPLSQPTRAHCWGRAWVKRPEELTSGLCRRVAGGARCRRWAQRHKQIGLRGIRSRQHQVKLKANNVRASAIKMEHPRERQNGI